METNFPLLGAKAVVLWKVHHHFNSRDFEVTQLPLNFLISLIIELAIVLTGN